jgi:hypothetical protein
MRTLPGRVSCRNLSNLVPKYRHLPSKIYCFFLSDFEWIRGTLSFLVVEASLDWIHACPLGDVLDSIRVKGSVAREKWTLRLRFPLSPLRRHGEGRRRGFFSTRNGFLSRRRCSVHRDGTTDHLIIERPQLGHELLERWLIVQAAE